MPFAALFSRLILRPLRREPIRTCLTIAAVALGVAAVLAIELAGEAAAGSFRSSLETLSGSANLEVTTSGGIPSEVLSRLAALPYPLKLHPRIEDYALIAGPTRRTVALIGIDLVAEASNRGATPVEIPAAQDFNPGDSVWVSPGLGYRNGDRIRLLINDSMIDYTVRGVLPESSGDAVIMDLAPAAEALRRGARLDRILLETPPDRSVDAWEALLRRELPAGVSIARQGTQTDENRRMMAAFRWNLRVLSYVSLAVGAFLIYNTISVSVVRRRYEIGILRALGTARAGILAAFLSEAAFFGIIGGAAGIALGRVLAEGAVKLVGATVQSLYLSHLPGSSRSPASRSAPASP
jgi:putative ABC transport system permease protein